jgi:hypothetical protein
MTCFGWLADDHIRTALAAPACSCQSSRMLYPHKITGASLVPAVSAIVPPQIPALFK